MVASTPACRVWWRQQPQCTTPHRIACCDCLPSLCDTNLTPGPKPCLAASVHAVFVVDLLPPVAASFADVCAAQRSRMLGSTSSGTRSRSSASSYLSSPSSGPRHASNRTVGTPGSLRRRLGLFSCFRAVAEDEEGQEEAEVAAGAALEQVPCPPEPAGSEASGAATTNQQQEPAGPELPVVRVSESKSLHVS